MLIYVLSKRPTTEVLRKVVKYVFPTEESQEIWRQS
jgi:hypothetical protein